MGNKIVSTSIELLNKLGYDNFTFKKLAKEIGSTESSIYRYFDNKLKLLVYLTSWYWSWIEYIIDYKTHYITDIDVKIKQVLKIICHAEEGINHVGNAHVKVDKLRQIVSKEAYRTYYNNKVDDIYSEGLFYNYKNVCHKISLLLLEKSQSYGYSHTLVSTIMNVSHQQTFFAMHLPSLTEIKREDELSLEKQVYNFIKELTFKQLN